MRSANWSRPTTPSGATPRRRTLSSAILALMALALLLGSAAQAAPALAGERHNRINPRLAADIDARPSDTFRVIVQRTNGRRDADDVVRTLGGRKRRDMAINGFVAELSAQAIRRLANNPGVKLISLDAELVSTGVPVSAKNVTSIFTRSVRASNLWPLGMTGSGVGVAVIDSGISGALTDWAGADGASRVVARQAFVDTPPAQADPSGHGTLVAGILAGDSWTNGNAALRGRYMGVAPGAHLIDLVVSDASGKSYTSDVVEAIEWAIANRVTYNIRVMNLSLVSGTPESYTTSVLAAAVERAWFSGIFVVAAAGNAGPDTALYPPANDPFVVTVGASDPNSTLARADDLMASWSSYGTTQDGFSKPDVVAPGRYMPGPVSSPSATLPMQFPERLLADTGGTYMWMSGTSMSAPVVAGIAALVFEQHPGWTNDQVKWLLANTSSTIAPSGTALPGQGAGQVDAYEAVLYPNVPTYANQGLVPSSHLVISGGGTSYNSASWSTASWSTASWSTASWSTASWSTASWSTASWSTTVQLQATAVDVGAPDYAEQPAGQ